MNDCYLTIANEAHAEIKIKGSRFIGETFHVRTAEEALQKLNIVRQREYAATHHCYAWQVGVNEEKSFKYSDAGEPSGTAGKPIYDVIAGHDITMILLVVTRYFGGTKLGTGGLVRAYSDTAVAVMDKSGIKENYLTADYKIILEFPHYDRWLKIINNLGARVVDAAFAEKVTMQVEIRLSRVERLKQAFMELTGGKGVFESLK
ncbi:MAG: YigZ family protein [candidate division Zixibacteria bacterium]|nr:YigZ family protein [candidate division Zixibacteria bacterium]MDD5427258.1 YigZ family protein [candidate division Zixibacteria bacterium]